MGEEGRLGGVGSEGGGHRVYFREKSGHNVIKLVL